MDDDHVSDAQDKCCFFLDIEANINIEHILSYELMVHLEAEVEEALKLVPK